MGTDRLDLHGILQGRGAADLAKVLRVTDGASGETFLVNLGTSGFVDMVVLDGVHHVTVADLLQAGSLVL